MQSVARVFSVCEPGCGLSSGDRETSPSHREPLVPDRRRWRSAQEIRWDGWPDGNLRQLQLLRRVFLAGVSKLDRPRTQALLEGPQPGR